ncbi:hypothetical protein BDFB_014600, partial [Asbolus verrucosus]
FREIFPDVIVTFEQFTKKVRRLVGLYRETGSVGHKKGSGRPKFCQWFMENLDNNDVVLEKTFFSDEAWFHLSGYVNSQNMRMWSSENPYYYVEEPLHPQKNWSLGHNKQKTTNWTDIF